MEGLAADFLYSHDADGDGNASAWLVLGLAGTYAFLLLLSLSAQKGIISRRHLAARSHQAHVFVRVGLKKKKRKAKRSLLLLFFLQTNVNQVSEAAPPFT